MSVDGRRCDGVRVRVDITIDAIDLMIRHAIDLITATATTTGDDGRDGSRPSVDAYEFAIVTRGDDRLAVCTGG